MKLADFIEKRKKMGANLIQTPRYLVNKDTNCVEALIYNDSVDSLDISKSDGRTIYFTGNKTTTGYPTLNQLWQHQQMYLNSKNTANLFPVFYKQNTGIIMGMYRVENIYKNTAPNGCSYFIIRLVRQINNKNLN